MPNKRRIFIGYIISKELQKTIDEWRSHFVSFPVRWMSSENLHTTLVPPWYEEDVEAVLAKLQSASKYFSSFPIHLDTVSLGPDKRNPRLIWAKGETPENFIRLKKSLVAVLKKEEDNKKPLLHITLARFNKAQAAAFPKPFSLQKIQWSDKVRSISLIESHLHPTGSEYETLATIRFE